MLEEYLRKAREETNSERVSVWIVKGSHLYLVHADELSEEIKGKMTLCLKTDVDHLVTIAAVFDTWLTISYSDIKTISELEAITEYEVSRSLVVPIKKEGRVVAILQVLNGSKDYTFEDVAKCAQISEEISLALQDGDNLTALPLAFPSSENEPENEIERFVSINAPKIAALWFFTKTLAIISTYPDVCIKNFITEVFKEKFEIVSALYEEVNADIEKLKDAKMFKHQVVNPLSFLWYSFVDLEYDLKKEEINKKAIVDTLSTIAVEFASLINLTKSHLLLRDSIVEKALITSVELEKVIKAYARFFKRYAYNGEKIDLNIATYIDIGEKTEKFRFPFFEFKEIFVVFLENAAQELAEALEIKSIGTPKIEISLNQYDDEHIVLKVKDNGRGIPPCIRDRIFEKFFTSGKRKGTGIGLGVVAHLAKRIGATVEQVNNVDGGSTFSLILSLEK